MSLVDIQEKKEENIQTKRELFNMEAEHVILGTIIANNNYLNKIIDFLLPEHFYDPVNCKIYKHISHLSNINIVANSVTLKQFFENNEDIKTIGGFNYLKYLTSRATAIVDIQDYGKIIYDLALKRDLAMIGEDIVNEIYNGEENAASNQIEEAESKLFKLTQHGGINGDFNNISLSLQKNIENTKNARQRDGSLIGASTKFTDIDAKMSGFQNSDLIILAGRPSMGKTAFGINIAYNICKSINEEITDKKQQKAVGFISLEMSAEQLSARILSMETSINSMKFRTGNIDNDEMESLIHRSKEISEMPFFIDDTPALSIGAVRTRVRRMVRKNNLSFVVVDYLQLLRGSGKKSNENRVQEISEITQGLKSIAKEFNIPVLALSQLSRAVEQREDKKPQLSDLRESGSIEQDADIVLFIYRESYYHERERPTDESSEKFEVWKEKMQEIRNEADVIIAKQRNGPIGNIKLYFDAAYTRFGNYDYTQRMENKANQN
jgi:replicative DNA helicase